MTKKRTKSRPWGSVQIKQGRHYAVYTAHKGSARRIWEPVTPNTRTRALDLLAQRRHELAAGTWEDPTRVVRFETLAREWYATMSGQWSGQSAKLHKTRLERHILPALGDHPARSIDAPVLQRLVDDLGDALAPRTVRVVGRTVRQILKWGSRNHRIRALPDLTVNWPKLTRRSVDPLTHDEIRRVLDAALEYRPLLMWAMFTGMRQGEVLAAKWKHLNRKAGTYHVCESLNRDAEIGPTKTGEVGDVWVPQQLLDALDDQQAQIAAWRLAADRWDDHDLLFPSKHRPGRPQAHTATIRALRVASDAASVRRRRFHDLRHTCASLLIDQGETIVTVAKQLRHSDPSITLGVYSHMMPERGPEAMAKLAKAILG